MNTLKGYFTIIIACIIFSPIAAQLNGPELKWASSHIRPVTTLISNGSLVDLSFLDTITKNKKIISIGESSHGTKEFFQIKTRIVKYLHEKLHYNVLIMESSLAETFAAYTNLQNISDTALLKRTQFKNFQCTEFLELFTYIKQNAAGKNPLQIVGLDCQMSSNTFPSFLFNLLEPIDSNFAKQALANLRLSPLLNQKHTDTIAFFEVRNRYISGIKSLDSFITTHSKELTARYPQQNNLIPYLKRTFKNLHDFFNVPPHDFDDPQNRIHRRDRIMYENVSWYVNQLYPESKFIIWSHNLHIGKSDMVKGGKMMGEYIADNFRDQSYSLALFAEKGETFQFWDSSVVNFDNSSDSSLEKKLSPLFTMPAAFVNLQDIKKSSETKWLFEESRVFELEVGREHNIIPALRHDGIILVKHSSLPTFLH